jgi:hypothetical protein
MKREDQNGKHDEHCRFRIHTGYIPLLGNDFDNEKGLFEVIGIILQNDELMKAQRTSWDSNVSAHTGERGLDDKKSGKVKFHKGIGNLE